MREVSVQLNQSREKERFCGHDRNLFFSVRRGRSRYFAVEIEDETSRLHGFEDWIVLLPVQHAGLGIGGHASGICFDTHDACSGGFVDGAVCD